RPGFPRRQRAAKRRVDAFGECWQVGAMRRRPLYVLILLIVLACGDNQGAGAGGGGPGIDACLTGVTCAADADCGMGERCNLEVAMPQCEKLYCGAIGTQCSQDEVCTKGLKCVAKACGTPPGPSTANPLDT